LGNVKDLIKDKEDLKEIGKEIVELGKEAARAGVNVGYMYDGLGNVKDLIKDKEDLKEIGKEMVELGKEAARAGVNVWGMYEFGLGNVKDLIKDKEDLKMIVELGKEAARAGVDVGYMYEYGLGNVKEKYEELREKGQFEVIKTAVVEGFLTPKLLDELSKAHEQGKLKEKIKEIKKKRDEIIEKKEIKSDEDIELLYGFTDYLMSYSEFKKELDKMKKVEIEGKKPFDGFKIEVKRQVTEFRPEDIEKINSIKTKIKEAYEKHNKKKQEELKKELLALQKNYDKTKDKALEKELIEGYIALTLMKDETLRNDVLSEKPEVAVTNIYQLIQDRIEDTKNEILTEPERLSALFEEQKIKIEGNDYSRALEFYEKEKEKLIKEREKLKEELKEKQKIADKYEVNRLGSEIGRINKELRQIASYEDALRFRTEELKKVATKLDSIMARAKKKERAFETLVFETEKSFLDDLAGYISKDCTKGRSEFFANYFSTDKAHNIKIFREKEGHKTWIGNLYLLHPEENVFIIDALQLATPTQYKTEELWKEVVAKIKERIGNAKLYVSEFLSNYEQVKKGFEKAFPNAKKIDYKLKGFDIFESSHYENFFEV
jgi:hypothetical protein